MKVCCRGQSVQGRLLHWPPLCVGVWRQPRRGVLPQGDHLPVCHQQMQLIVMPLCARPLVQRGHLLLYWRLARLSPLPVRRPLQRGGLRVPTAAAVASQTPQLFQRHCLHRLAQHCLWRRLLGQWLPRHSRQRRAQKLVAQYPAMQRRAGCCVFPCPQPGGLVRAPMASSRVCGAGLCPGWCGPQRAQHCNLQGPLKLLLRLQQHTLQRSGHSSGVAGAKAGAARMRACPARGCWPHLQLSVCEHSLLQCWP